MGRAACTEEGGRRGKGKGGWMGVERREEGRRGENSGDGKGRRERRRCQGEIKANESSFSPLPLHFPPLPLPSPHYPSTLPHCPLHFSPLPLFLIQQMHTIALNVLCVSFDRVNHKHTIHHSMSILHFYSSGQCLMHKFSSIHYNASIHHTHTQHTLYWNDYTLLM